MTQPLSRHPSLEDDGSKTWRHPGQKLRARLVKKDEGENSGFVLSPTCSLEKYHQVSEKVLDQFLQHPIETREELLESYLVGTRLLKFMETVLPTHPDFHKSTELKLKSTANTHELAKYLGEIAFMIDREEHELYVTKVLVTADSPPSHVEDLLLEKQESSQKQESGNNDVSVSPVQHELPVQTTETLSLSYSHSPLSGSKDVGSDSGESNGLAEDGEKNGAFRDTSANKGLSLTATWDKEAWDKSRASKDTRLDRQPEQSNHQVASSSKNGPLQRRQQRRSVLKNKTSQSIQQQDAPLQPRSPTSMSRKESVVPAATSVALLHPPRSPSPVSPQPALKSRTLSGGKTDHLQPPSMEQAESDVGQMNEGSASPLGLFGHLPMTTSHKNHKVGQEALLKSPFLLEDQPSSLSCSRSCNRKVVERFGMRAPKTGPETQVMEWDDSKDEKKDGDWDGEAADSLWKEKLVLEDNKSVLGSSSGHRQSIRLVDTEEEEESEGLGEGTESPLNDDDDNVPLSSDAKARWRKGRRKRPQALHHFRQCVKFLLDD